VSEVNGIIASMKQAALEAVAATLPCAHMVGTVESVDPLNIRISQKLVLNEERLILTNAVRDYIVDVTVDHLTEVEDAHTHPIIDTYTGGGGSLPTTHLHGYEGRKTFVVHLDLSEGEKVLLLRVQGGQKYIVLDRVEAPDVTVFSR